MAGKRKTDPKLTEAIMFIKQLDPEDGGNQLIQYYIQDLKVQIFNLQCKLGEYKMFFSTLENLMPKRHKTLGS